jgi:AraC family transcriptional regulator, transcriptional activator of pobA
MYKPILDIFAILLDKTCIFEMKKELINFEGLYGDSVSTRIEDFVSFEPLASRSKYNNWIIKPHFHSQLQQLFFIESGSGVILLENNEIHFNSPCIICIPENMEHGFRFKPNSVGSVVTFSHLILDKIFINSPQIKLDFGKIKIVDISNQNKQFNNLIQFLGQLKTEIEASQLEKNTMILAILTSFLIEIYRLAQAQNTMGIAQKNKSLNIFNAFQKSIHLARNPQKNIADYASELSITPLHLNRICKEVNKNRANEIVNHYFLAEAQKYLTFTDYSISEIAFLLNFNDPAYFSRFFKKEKGLSPKDFKNSKKSNF